MIEIERDIRQSDIKMSPKLFTAILEYAFKMLDWNNRGINIDEERLNQLRFADDIVLISDNSRDVREMLYKL